MVTRTRLGVAAPAPACDPDCARERVWAAVAALPPATVASYGEIARRAGLPRRARWVASALRAAPAVRALPWHRVVRADGRIAFPPGSEAFHRQKCLLEAEGLRIAGNGRVLFADTGAIDLDRVLWHD